MSDEQTTLLDDDPELADATAPDDAPVDDSPPESSASPTETASSDAAASPSVDAAPDENAFWRQRLEQAGYSNLPPDLTAESVKDFLAEQRRQTIIAQQQANNFYQRLQAQQQAAPQQQAYAQPAKPQNRWEGKWNPPEFNKSWLTEWRDPETGQFKPETPPDVRMKAIEYARFRQEQTEKFWENPLEYVYSGIREQLLQDVSQVSQQTVQQREQEHWAHQQHAEIGAWAYEYGPNGQVLQLPDGSPAMSIHGQRYVGHSQQLLHAGVHDPRVRHQLVLDRMRGEDAQWQYQQAQMANPAAQAAAAQQANVSQQQAYMAKHAGGGKPNRGGTLRTAADTDIPQNKSSIINDALTWAKEHGIDLAAPAA